MNWAWILLMAIGACMLVAVSHQVRRAARRSGLLHGAAVLSEYARYLRDICRDEESSDTILDGHTLLLDTYLAELADARGREKLRAAARSPLSAYMLLSR